MNNYIIYGFNGYNKTHLTLTPATVEGLKKATPVGCPFDNYTLFDLLVDLIKMYSWKMDRGKKYTISHFLELTNNIKAVVYKDVINSLIID